MTKNKGMIGGIALAIIIAIGLIILLLCATHVPTGYVSVIYNMDGGVDGEVLSQGWHVISPTKKATPYSIGIEQSYLTSDKVGDSPNDESFYVPTSDGKMVKVELEFSYKFDESRVADTFTNFKGKSGEEIKDTFIKPKIKAWTQEVTAVYPAADLYGEKRTAINAELDVHLRDKFDKYGIIIDTVNFTNISPDDETAAAIQKKVNAQQEQEVAQIEAQTAQIQANKDKEVARIAAEKDKEVAQIESEKALIEANAQAEVIRIAAEAEAEANEKIAKSLTPELIEKTKYERWNGELPTVTGAGSTIIDIGE